MKVLELGVAIATIGLIGLIALGRDDKPAAVDNIADVARPAAVSAEASDPKVDDLTRRWYAANEHCAGDYNPSQAVCDQRDRIAHQLDKLGWCYPWSDLSYSAADSEWHRCSIARPNRPPQGDPEAAAEAANMIQPTSTADPSAEAQYQEDQRPKSPALARYEKAVGDLFWKSAIIEMLWKCDLRDGTWYGDAVRLTNSRFRAMITMRAQLTNEEFMIAERYSKRARDNAISWYMGEPKINKVGCKAIAGMPLAHTDLFLFQ